MFEMRFGGALRHQQAKDQVDRVTVMGVVVERMPKAYERADAVVDAGHAAMRNRHAVTQAGTAELFACREAAKDIAGIEVAGACQQVRSDEHTSELQSLMRISNAGICLTKKSNTNDSE